MPRLEIIDPWGSTPRYTFLLAVRKGNLLFIAGLIATDEKGNIVAHTRRCFEKIKNSSTPPAQSTEAVPLPKV